VPLIRPGIAVNIPGPVELIPKGLAGNITLGLGWTQAGARAFQYVGPQLGAPALAIDGLVAGKSYRIAANVTEFTGTGTIPAEVGALASVAFTISGVGLYVNEKIVAGATFDELRLTATTGVLVDSCTIKSLYITALD
jgi:hypothetical protein